MPSQVSPAPTKFSADINSIEIRWTAPENGGSAITDYKVYWDAGLTNFVQLGTSNGFLSFITATGTLTGGTQYGFKVSA